MGPLLLQAALQGTVMMNGGPGLEGARMQTGSTSEPGIHASIFISRYLCVFSLCLQHGIFDMARI